MAWSKESNQADGKVIHLTEVELEIARLLLEATLSPIELKDETKLRLDTIRVPPTQVKAVAKSA